MQSNVYFCLASFHAEKPDGSTNILIARYKALKNAGIACYFVIEHPNHINTLPLDSQIYTYASLPIEKDSLYITSWDWHLHTLITLGVNKRNLILYAQSYFANHAFDFPGLTITISDYAKQRIKEQGAMQDILVINNGINFEETFKYYQTSKINSICTAFCNRDSELLAEFKAKSILEVIELPKLTHEQFLEEISKYEYYLNFYKEEGFGLPPLEAMAVGTTPIILFKHGSLAYANYTNCIGLENTTDIKLPNKQDLSSIKQFGLETAKRFEISNSNLDFINLIKDLTDEPF